MKVTRKVVKSIRFHQLARCYSPKPLVKTALPQIEWVNIFIEPANTRLSVIPAEAGIQCLLAPGRWIMKYIHVFYPADQP